MLKRWPLILWAVIFFAALCFLFVVRSILFPFIASLFLALLLDPWVDHLQARRPYSRPQCVLVIYSLFVLLVALAGAWLWRPIKSQAEELPATVTVSLENAQIGLKSFLLAHPSLINRYRQNVPIEIYGPPIPASLHLPVSPSPARLETREETIDRLLQTYLGQVPQKVNDLGPAMITSLLSSGAGVLSKLLNLILIPIITFFILIDLDMFRKQAINLVPKPFRKPVTDTMEAIGEVFVRYVRGLITAASMYALIATIEFTLLGLPYSLVLGLLAGILYFIPYIGPLTTVTLVSATAAILPSPHKMLFFVSFGTPLGYTIAVALISMTVYFIFDQLVTPRVVGGAVGLHPVFAFFAIMSGAALFGIPGMLLAYPIAGSIKVILSQLMPVMRLNEDSLEPTHKVLH